MNPQATPDHPCEAEKCDEPAVREYFTTLGIAGRRWLCPKHGQYVLNGMTPPLKPKDGRR